MATSKKQSSLENKLSAAMTKTGIGEVYCARARYDFSKDGGAAAAITPKANVMIPKNALLVGGYANVIAAVTGALSNITIGTDAGSSASALLGTTAKPSTGVIALVPTMAVPVTMTAKGQVTITPDGTISAGIVEVLLFFVVLKA